MEANKMIKSVPYNSIQSIIASYLFRVCIKGQIVGFVMLSSALSSTEIKRSNELKKKNYKNKKQQQQLFGSKFRRVETRLEAMVVVELYLFIRGFINICPNLRLPNLFYL